MLPYVLIGLFCGLSGLIWSARLGSAAATLGSGFEMDAIAAVVIGGTSMSGGVGTVGGTFYWSFNYWGNHKRSESYGHQFFLAGSI